MKTKNALRCRRAFG